jgi:hypothetical protein
VRDDGGAGSVFSQAQHQRNGRTQRRPSPVYTYDAVEKWKGSLCRNLGSVVSRQDGANCMQARSKQLAISLTITGWRLLDRTVSALLSASTVLDCCRNALQACSNRLVRYAVSVLHSRNQGGYESRKKNLSQELAIPSAGSRSDGPGAMWFDSGTGIPRSLPVPGSRVQALIEPPGPPYPDDARRVCHVLQRPARRSHSCTPRRGDQQPPAWCTHNPNPRLNSCASRDHTGRVASRAACSRLRSSGGSRVRALGAPRHTRDRNRPASSNSSTTVFPVCPCTHLELHREPRSAHVVGGASPPTGRAEAERHQLFRSRSSARARVRELVVCPFCSVSLHSIARSPVYTARLSTYHTCTFG